MKSISINRESRTAELHLESLVQGGDCLARLDGEVVLVRQGIPGETVVAEVFSSKKGLLRGRVLEVLDPSPYRTEPRCEYFGECGGCQLQHIQYDRQLELKRLVVAEQLRRIGGFEDIKVLPTIGAEEPWGYRNNARFSCRRGDLGFTRFHSRRLIRIEHCPVMHPAINEVLADVQGKVERKLHQLVVRVGVNTGQVLIQPALTEEETAFESGQDSYEEELLGKKFRVSATAFFQVNTLQAERLVGLARDFIAPQGKEVLLDVYCGVGSFGLIMVDHVREVIGIEDLAAALRDAAHNAASVGNISFIHGAAEKVLPKLRVLPDAVILDPPRAGCRPEVIEALIKTGPQKIVYVSCDPATLARDLKLFCEGGYNLDKIQPVDMFPHTQHVETVVLMSKK